MASHKSALKQMRKDRNRRDRNRARRSALRTALKTARAAVSTGEPDKAQQLVARAMSLLDRTASQGIIHRNAAARVKSRLSRQLKKPSGTAAA